MYLLYSALLACALAVGSPFWLFEMLRHGKYKRGFGERLGIVPQRIRKSRRPSIWVHAVSVGEVLAVSGLIEGLGDRYPGHRIVISTTTDTGHRLAAARFGAERVFYFPFDFRQSLIPYFDALGPQLVVIAETEFWPNFLRLANERGARVAVVNARISDRSFPGYRRWRRFLGRILSTVDLSIAQTAEDARRLVSIGAPANRVLVGGNLKFDVPAPPAAPIVDRLRSALRPPGPVLVCGSTVEGEETLLLDSFKCVRSAYPGATMLLAPRHPERFPAVAELLERSSIAFSKRSEWKGEALRGGALLVDSIGELASLYALADVAFVGGSLVPRGGHSILEPAQHGVAIVVGPHTENFRDIVALFQTEHAVRVVHPGNLNDALLELVTHENARRELGQRALKTLASQQGATRFAIEKLAELLRGNLDGAQIR
ncbi:MAG: 3-deoxy-D-manno-octulosonic acid transferase [Acidobacteria bacterium]|nr:3-deoxy-D-manno-octulosonic acid transferase [Acidobacteriota bacterium]